MAQLRSFLKVHRSVLLGTVAVLFAAAGAGTWSYGQQHGFSSWSVFPCMPFFSEELPQISMLNPPAFAPNRNLLVSYAASDCSCVKEVSLRITPHNPLPGANNASVNIPLPVRGERKIARTDAQNLTFQPWWGQKVTLQIVATNDAGKSGTTEAVDLTFPERQFYHPIARVLIQEREKLMQHPDDGVLREEAANIMASIAHQPSNYRGDPVVLLALRGGAVRLILQKDREAAISVNDLLWRAATRIEDAFARAS
ncbi:MAG: DUF4175 family protein [Alphaproteobacteria bacterium]|nr:DUF4175 family protein [Alphaproteobacteria bacterium]